MEETKKTDAIVKDDVKKDDTTNAENQPKTYTQDDFNKAVEEAVKAKLDEARKNGFAEGQRKASKNVNEGLKTENQDLMNRLANLENELAMQRHFQTLNNLNVIEAKKGDVLDLLRGKGLDFNEENITKIVKDHPEWITPKESKGIVEMGQTGATSKESQEEMDRKQMLATFREQLGLDKKKK